jgi:tRNA U34 2-thiouridine synthase MnmA/TrmU
VNYLEPNPGPIYELETGLTLGTHNGLWTYTIGQGTRIPGLKERYFVASKSKEKNAIYAVNNSSVGLSPFPASPGFSFLGAVIAIIPLYIDTV